MDDHAFRRYMEAMQQRLTAFQRRYTDNTALPQEEQLEVWEALHTAMEELHVAHAELMVARQEAEAERQRYQELCRARNLESLGVLAGGIAHDFNNLLTAILGNVSLAKMLADSPEKREVLLTRAEAACQQSKALTQQLLTFAKGETPVRQTACITDLIKEAARFALHGSKVRCGFAFPDDLWPVEVDAGQMHQVFHNVMLNAAQAMPRGGSLHVRIDNLCIGTDSPVPLPPGRYVQIVLSDHGVGISAEHLPKIFDPYFTTKERGHGFGLAIAYAIVTKHQGHITVESEEGAGTTCSLYLPAAYSAHAPQEDVEVRPGVCMGKILVMDDEAMVRDLVVDMLTRLGYEVESACDGTEAIVLYRRAKEAGQPFMAVILDLTVAGGMGGQESIAILRQIDPQVYAIVSSGYVEDTVMADFRRDGFSGVVAKPYTVQGLRDVLQRLLPGRRP